MIRGYAAVFYSGDPGTEFSLGDGIVERMMPNAFDAALRSSDPIVALFNHDMSLLLGRRSAGTLRLGVDERGLKYEVEPSDTAVYRDVLAHQEAGNLIGSSLGFRVVEQRMVDDSGVRVRQIHSMAIRDVGPVTYPAYVGTEENRCVNEHGIYLQSDSREMAEVRSVAIANTPAIMSAMVHARRIAIDTDRFNG